MTNTPGRCGFLLVLGLAMMTGAAGASEVVREFRGDRDTTTSAFVVDAPWVIEWRVGSDFPQSARFELWIVDATTGFNDSRVMLDKEHWQRYQAFFGRRADSLACQRELRRLVPENSRTVGI